MIRGMIIKESLIDVQLLSHPLLTIVERYPMRMDGKYPIEVVMVDVPDEQLAAALALVSGGLLQAKYYAHFVAGALMYVVYPWTISVVKWGDEESARLCIDIGAKFEVPAAQLPMTKMFNFGHAEHP
jgi:hypothetical protein